MVNCVKALKFPSWTPRKHQGKHNETIDVCFFEHRALALIMLECWSRHWNPLIFIEMKNGIRRFFTFIQKWWDRTFCHLIKIVKWNFIIGWFIYRKIAFGTDIHCFSKRKKKSCFVQWKIVCTTLCCLKDWNKLLKTVFRFFSVLNIFCDRIWIGFRRIWMVFGPLIFVFPWKL